jgi:hypothetical protein
MKVEAIYGMASRIHDFRPKPLQCLVFSKHRPCHVKVAKRGVNRVKLKFTKLITTTSRVSVRNIIESEREGAKQITSE